MSHAVKTNETTQSTSTSTPEIPTVVIVCTGTAVGEVLNTIKVSEYAPGQFTTYTTEVATVSSIVMPTTGLCGPKSDK